MDNPLVIMVLLGAIASLLTIALDANRRLPVPSRARSQLAYEVVLLGALLASYSLMIIALITHPSDIPRPPDGVPGWAGWILVTLIALYPLTKFIILGRRLLRVTQRQ